MHDKDTLTFVIEQLESVAEVKEGNQTMTIKRKNLRTELEKLSKELVKQQFRRQFPSDSSLLFESEESSLTKETDA